MVVPPSLEAALAGQISAPPQPPPEISAFEVPEGAPEWGFEIPEFSIEKELPNFKSFVDRNSALALVAAKVALLDSGLPAEREPAAGPSEIGCSYGSMFGCLEAMGIFWNKVKTSNPKFAQPLPFTHGYANSPSSLLCIQYGLRGPAATFSGERLAGIEALLFAHDQIASGSAGVMLAGASEHLSQAAYLHLLSSGQLSQTGKWDDGIIPGEGAVMLVLESEDSAHRRNARIYAEIEGVNFFPMSPASALEPIRIATPPQETVFFVSTPNGGSVGDRISPPLTADIPSIATKYYSGDMFSVSPLLGVCLGAGILGKKIFIALKAGDSGLPLLHPTCQLDETRYSVATGYDGTGLLGVVMSRRGS